MTALEEIRDRAEAATKGPWNVDDEEQTVRARTYAGEIMFDRSAYGRAVWGREDRADAEFIAHARMDIPRLLAALDALNLLAKEMEATRTDRKASSFYKGYASGVRAAGCRALETITAALEANA